MTRWLYLCNDLGIPLDGSKGASTHVRAITRALCTIGRDVAVLAARGRLPADHPARQIESAAGDAARTIDAALRKWLTGNGAVPALAGEIAQMRYDAELSRLLEADELEIEADVVLERLSLFASAGLAFARRRGLPFLVEMNAPLSREAARYRDAGMEQLARQIERHTLTGADAVITVSEELRQYTIAQMGLSPQRVHTVPNGVDLGLFGRRHDRAAARAEAGVPANALVYGFVGSLKAWHGVETLLDAFRHVRNAHRHAHLLIIGNGRMSDYYRAKAVELGVDQSTTFFGAAAHETVARLLSGADIAVAPYLPQDTFYFSPLKLYEYMAAGLCVVASRAGQIAEVIDCGKNGLLFTPGRSGELAEVLIYAGTDAALRARLSAAARRCVAGRGWEHVAEKITGIAESVAQRPAAPVEDDAYAAA